MKTTTTNTAIISGFLAWAGSLKGLTASTVAEYGKDIARLTAWLESVPSGRGLGLQYLNTAIAELWAQSMARDGKKATTINRRLATISQLGAYMEHQGLCPIGQLSGIVRPKRAKTLPKPADGTTVARFLMERGGDPDTLQLQAITQLQLQTGLRISEVLTLRYEDVRKDDRAILIHGKGMKERRVYYTDETARRLNAWARCTQEHTGNIFTLSYLEAYERMTQRMRKNGRGITPHQLRHLFATRQLERGTDVMTIAAMMGHDDITTTRRYAGVSDTRQRSAFRG